MLIDDFKQRHQPAALEQFVRQSAASVTPAANTASEIRMPNMPPAPATGAGGRIDRRRLVRDPDEPIDAPASPYRVRPYRLRRASAVPMTHLTQRARGQREQSLDRHYGRTNAGLVDLPGESVGGIARREHRVDAPAPTSSARDATPMMPSAPVEHNDELPHLPEQGDVCGVEGAQEDTTRSSAALVGRDEQPQLRSGGFCVSDEVPGRVDDAGIDELFGRPTRRRGRPPRPG